MVTLISSKMMAKHGSPSASQDADVVGLFRELLEDEEAEEVFREFIVPAQRRQTRLPWFLPPRSTLQYPVILLPSEKVSPHPSSLARGARGAAYPRRENRP
jgi:hypothetical protein